MSQIKLSQKNYNTAIRLIRRFASGFTSVDGYDLRKGFNALSRYRVRKATTYLREITALTARPHVVIRPRKKERLKFLQQFARHTRELSQLKVAFVPVADPKAALKIKYKNDKVKEVIESGKITRREYLFNVPSLIEDTLGEVTHVIDVLKGRQYFLMAGEYDIPESAGDSPESVTDVVKRYMSRYSADKYDPDDKNGSYFGNWLRGLISYDYESDGVLLKHLSHKRRIREILKELRRTKSLKKKQRLLKQLREYRLKK